MQRGCCTMGLGPRCRPKVNAVWILIVLTTATCRRGATEMVGSTQRLGRPSDPTHLVTGRIGDCPRPRKETTEGRNVTQGGGCWGDPPPLRR